MPTTTPTRVLDDRGRSWTGTGASASLPSSLFFDDRAEVMYRKIDTTPLSATSPQGHDGLGRTAGLQPGASGVFLGLIQGDLWSSFIPSRMTHRPVLASAGGPSERMFS